MPVPAVSERLPSVLAQASAGSGGQAFRLTALLQRRVRELVNGSQPLVAVPRHLERDWIRIAMLEHARGLIELEEDEFPSPGWGG